MHDTRLLLHGALVALLGLAMIAPASRSDDSDALMVRFDKMVQYNLDNPTVVPSAVLDSVAQAYQSLPLGDRISAWARWFLQRGDVGYLYGRNPGGYVSEGRLCMDHLTDCVLFMCRTTELARSTNAREAVQFAFGTRFYGASIAKTVGEDGKVNYDDPVHLEYSEDMIKSGIWGAEVTKECGDALVDTIGSSRVPPDTLHYVPAADIDYTKIHSGDIVWFIGDENEPGAADKRLQGTMIHHLGILSRNGDTIELIHPASRPLPGIYEKPGLVSVPLETYLKRVGRFKGIVVTRLVEF
jgi:hypothetical protein